MNIILALATIALNLCDGLCVMRDLLSSLPINNRKFFNNHTSFPTYSIVGFVAKQIFKMLIMPHSQYSITCMKIHNVFSFLVSMGPGCGVIIL